MKYSLGLFHGSFKKFCVKYNLKNDSNNYTIIELNILIMNAKKRSLNELMQTKDSFYVVPKLKKDLRLKSL